MIKGDIILIPFPFTDLTGNKYRPAVVLIATETDVTVCFLTTQLFWKEEYDIILEPNINNGLKKTSLLRINKITTITNDLALGKLGSLNRVEINALNNNLVDILQLKRD